MICGPVIYRRIVCSISVVCTIAIAVSGRPAMAATPAAKPTLDNLYQSADFKDTTQFIAVNRPTVGFLQVNFQDTTMPNGNLSVTIGKSAPTSIPVSSAQGKQQRVHLDLTQVPVGEQEISVVWAPTGTGEDPSPTSNVIKATIKKSVFTQAQAPDITGLFATDQTTSTETALAQVNTVNAPSKTAYIHVNFKETTVPAGQLWVTIGKVKNTSIRVQKGSADPQRFPLDLTGISMETAQKLSVIWDPDDDGEGLQPSASSNAIDVNIDMVPPNVTSVKLTGAPGATIAYLEIRFEQGDLLPKADGTTLNSQDPKFYVINRSNGSSSFSTPLGSGIVGTVELSSDHDLIRIPLSGLPTDNYQLTLGAVMDSHGNIVIQKDQKFSFNSFPTGETGQHVQFPEYTVRPDRNKKDLFNPGDRVETRVARLYYFRDAHRVAQIINRNVKSYNRAAVTMAQQNAEDARTLADQKAADRRQKEAAAIRAAEATRAAEQELAGARQTLDEIRAVNAQALQGAASATQAATELTRQKKTPEMLALERQSNDLKTKIDKMDASIATLTANQSTYTMAVGTKDDEIAGLEVQVNETKDEIVGADAAIQFWATKDSDLGKQITTLTAQFAAAAPANQPAIAAMIEAAKQQQTEARGSKTAAEKSRADALAEQKTAMDTLTKAKKDRAVAAAKAQSVTDRLNTEVDARETSLRQKEAIDARLVDLTNAPTDLTAQAAALTVRAGVAKTAVSEFVAKVAAAETKVANLRETERNKQEEIAKSQEVEDRARENQFRAEVAAASTDPDTYAPGQVTSVDPVTQVSISVIGEGLIQLRGPIRGINKIRTMINQIDSPVGQVKVGIFTVQVNGEHGDRMEKVAARIEGNIDLSRFLTNQSLGLLRRSIQEVAGLAVKNVDIECRGNRQLDRDRRYLYGFFGRDFIDELYEMDSEFLHTENKVLSLHSMDTVSQSQAFFILSLAKNDVRQMILERFRYLIQAEMPCIEWDYRRSASMTRKIDHQKINSLKEVHEQVYKKYHFSNLHGFFNAWVDDTDAITPMQREFIRLAQIFKSQMVAELEYKQRVIERGLIEDQANTEDEFNERLGFVRNSAEDLFAASLKNLVDVQSDLSAMAGDINCLLSDITSYAEYSDELDTDASNARPVLDMVRRMKSNPGDPQYIAPADAATAIRSLTASAEYKDMLETYRLVLIAAIHNPNATIDAKLIAPLTRMKEYYTKILGHYISRSQIYPASFMIRINNKYNALVNTSILDTWTNDQADQFAYTNVVDDNKPTYSGMTRSGLARKYGMDSKELAPAIKSFLIAFSNPKTKATDLGRAYGAMANHIKQVYPKDDDSRPPYVKSLLSQSEAMYRRIVGAEDQIARSKSVERRLRRDIDHRKLLEFLTDEQEEKYIELEEGCRSHIAQIDNYLKRLAIALEDDFKVQFYDPAFAEVRRASREWDVNLGQVERTTILTNNRAFAKVSPQATMEFDLPKRDIMITEAMSGAKAMVAEYGNLMQDPTFLSAAAMLSGSPAVGGVASGSPISGLPGQGLGAAGVRNVLPGQSTDATEQLMAQTGGPNRTFGSEFEKLIPDPAVYKIETGTGFEIRPVIQPDGHSIIYDFDYMYTTNIREPVRPDEKHLGRVKRHFIHTEVQTSSFELREISRYQVALKVSRTSRGVPLMEDIPGVGILFRPLPSAESSLQQNIILGQSTVYPTLFDLMGLRWSKHVVDLDHIGLRDLEHVIRGRNTTIHDFTFDEGSRRVDEFLDIETKDKDQIRPDLYRQQRLTSPYHPGGYHNSRLKDEKDPTGHEFNRPDTRPEGFREPPYDSKYRVPFDQARPVGNRPEVIEIRPETVQELPPPPNSGLSRPVTRTAAEIQMMKYETPAKTTTGSQKPQTVSPKSELTPAKPKMIKLPTIGTRKK